MRYISQTPRHATDPPPLERAFQLLAFRVHERRKLKFRVRQFASGAGRDQQLGRFSLTLGQLERNRGRGRPFVADGERERGYTSHRIRRPHAHFVRRERRDGTATRNVVRNRDIGEAIRRTRVLGRARHKPFVAVRKRSASHPSHRQRLVSGLTPFHEHVPELHLAARAERIPVERIGLDPLYRRLRIDHSRRFLPAVRAFREHGPHAVGERAVRMGDIRVDAVLGGAGVLSLRFAAKPHGRAVGNVVMQLHGWRGRRGAELFRRRCRTRHGDAESDTDLPEVHRISILIPQGCRTRRTPVPAKCASSFTAAAELDEP